MATCPSLFYLTSVQHSIRSTHAGSQTPSFSVDCSVPHWFSFRPTRLCFSYTEDVADLMDRHNVQFHLYADDTQFFKIAANQLTPLHCEHVCPAAHPTSSSGVDHAACMQLNASKTEAIWFGSKPYLAKLSITDQLSAVVRDLGFHLDSELCMETARGQDGRSVLLPPYAACARSAVASEKRLVIALVISRLDYCNSLLCFHSVQQNRPNAFRTPLLD